MTAEHVKDELTTSVTNTSLLRTQLIQDTCILLFNITVFYEIAAFPKWASYYLIDPQHLLEHFLPLEQPRLRRQANRYAPRQHKYKHPKANMQADPFLLMDLLAVKVYQSL